MYFFHFDFFNNVNNVPMICNYIVYCCELNKKGFNNLMFL